jgi:hypothetical protein
MGEPKAIDRGMPGASTGLFSGSEPIFACTSLHSRKSSFTSALLPRLSQEAASPVLWNQRGVLSWQFESYPLVPGCHAFLILHGIAETFGLDAELA